jgi:hypothetical protein
MVKSQNQRRWNESQQVVADRKLAKWILHSTSPIDTVNNNYLKELLAYLNPNYKLPTDKNLKLLIYQAYDWTEGSMKELLSSSAKYVSLTTDLWTSRAKQGYIGITASFISYDFKIYDILLELKYLPYPHKAEHIQNCIESTISKWGLHGKIIAVTTDNGSNMVKAISKINNVIRIPCTAHTLQLVIGKALKPALVFVARTKRLIRFFMYPKQTERLKAIQASLNYQQVLGVIGDVSTRWNSLYLAWERLLYLKDAIDQLATDLSRNRDNAIKKDGRYLKNINLVEEEWSLMEELVNLLGLFEEATTFLSGSTYTTLSLMHPTISAIKTIFESDDSFTDITDDEENKNNHFSDLITILDNGENEEDGQEFLEQPEEENDDVIDPTTQTRVKINQPMNIEGVIEKIKDIILQALYKYWDVPSDVALKAAFLDPRFKDLAFARSEKDRIIYLIQDELNQIGNNNILDNSNDENQGINNIEVGKRQDVSNDG